MGQAGSVRALSIPQSWAAAAPAFRQVATALPMTSATAAPEVAAASSGRLSATWPPVWPGGPWAARPV
ncbi:PPE family protein, SVP subgroup [Mycobacterium fragae]|nr:hypothetical protein [Mycobacterium fragae]